ncbi:hypothetical protein DsansV1_C16g0139471 [Dioscorea sansibarensis]
MLDRMISRNETNGCDAVEGTLAASGETTSVSGSGAAAATPLLLTDGAFLRLPIRRRLVKLAELCTSLLSFSPSLALSTASPPFDSAADSPDSRGSAGSGSPAAELRSSDRSPATGSVFLLPSPAVSSAFSVSPSGFLPSSLGSVELDSLHDRPEIRSPASASGVDPAGPFLPSPDFRSASPPGPPPCSASPVGNARMLAP